MLFIPSVILVLPHHLSSTFLQGTQRRGTRGVSWTLHANHSILQHLLPVNNTITDYLIGLELIFPPCFTDLLHYLTQ
ncbi:hypothetical protein GFC29_1507 [Anoxybacillus sp. B7M1]|nr:hypothetical protein GFC28_118 [Anoxybacillus sp. B2M1]ANB62913.1 hypothetical protein GFC29_1507 [Anoxybacillus sp. B7M1]